MSLRSRAGSVSASSESRGVRSSPRSSRGSGTSRWMTAPELSGTATTTASASCTREAPKGGFSTVQRRVWSTPQIAGRHRSRVEFASGPTTVDSARALLGSRSSCRPHRRSRFTPFKARPRQENVSKDTVLFIKERQSEFPGVDALALADRVYPQRDIGGPSSRLCRRDQRRRAEDKAESGDKAYRLGDSIGKSGVELGYENELRGTPAPPSSRSTPAATCSTPSTPSAGAGPGRAALLDLDAQHLVEESLARGSRPPPQLRQGEQKDYAAPPRRVVLDPRDGSVLPWRPTRHTTPSLSSTASSPTSTEAPGPAAIPAQQPGRGRPLRAGFDLQAREGHRGDGKA